MQGAIRWRLSTPGRASVMSQKATTGGICWAALKGMTRAARLARGSSVAALSRVSLGPIIAACPAAWQAIDKRPGTWSGGAWNDAGGDDRGDVALIGAAAAAQHDEVRQPAHEHPVEALARSPPRRSTQGSPAASAPSKWVGWAQLIM